MINKDLREYLQEIGLEDSLLFDNPSYDKSIVGYTDNGNIVYNYDKMVREFVEENNVDEIESMEFIDYNTMRALPYFGGEKHPIVINSIPEEYRQV